MGRPGEARESRSAPGCQLVAADAYRCDCFPEPSIARPLASEPRIRLGVGLGVEEAEGVVVGAGWVVVVGGGDWRWGCEVEAFVVEGSG